MSASSSTARSSASRVMTGTSGRFKSCAARQRRSPAISSKNSPRWRTMSGCTMPCSRMESESSFNASAENSLRGWSADGRTRFNGTRCTRSCGSGAASGGHRRLNGSFGCRLAQQRAASQQRAKTTSKSGFCHARRVSQGGELSTRSARVEPLIQADTARQHRMLMEAFKIADGPRERLLRRFHDERVGGFPMLPEAAAKAGRQRKTPCRSRWQRSSPGGYGHVGDCSRRLFVVRATDAACPEPTRAAHKHGQ